MAESIRLFGRAFPHRPLPVKQLRLRVTARNLPAGSRVQVTDVQLQPGRYNTGWVQASQDRQIEAAERFQWRNGVVHDDMTVIVVADTTDASPTRWDVRDAATRMKVGGYDFGTVHGNASVDGLRHSATQGAGIPPHLTSRADIDVPIHTGGGRALLTCWFQGLASSSSDIEPEPLPE